MNHGTPGQLGAPGDKVKMFLWRPGRRQEVLDRNLTIRESAKIMPWPPRRTDASGPARHAAAANQSPHPA
jgi:hypothetical protein